MNPAIYALLSDLVYEDNPKEILDKLNNGTLSGQRLRKYGQLEGSNFSIPNDKFIRENINNGYFGMAVQQSNGDFIVVHRGSDDKHDWGISNSEIIAGRIPKSQLNDANSLVERVKSEFGNNIEITQTGHSLGGVLAQYSAHQNGGQDAIAFEAPGIRKGIKSLESEGESRYENFDNYIVNGSYATNNSIFSNIVGEHVGQVHTIDRYLPDEEVNLLNAYPRHKIDNFIDAFDENGKIIKTLENPQYLDKLLKNRWKNNPEIGTEMLDRGLERTVRLKDEFNSFEDFKNSFIGENKEKLAVFILNNKEMNQEQETKEFLDDLNIDLYGENQPENHVEMDKTHEILMKISALNAAISNI